MEGSMKCYRNILLATVVFTLLCGTDPLQAQSRVNIEEIFVTARKQQESILNVPVIETIISNTALERTQTFSIMDLQKVVPGLTIGRNFHTIGTQVSLRGIGTTSSDQGVDSSVALNVDGL